METQNELQKICAEVEDTFRLMAFSRAGRRVLKEFLPRYRRGEIQIKTLDLKVSMEVVSGSSLTGTPAGGFVFDGVKKTIYMEKNSEVGVLTPLLFHEMVHSVDYDYLSSYFEQERIWENYRKRTREILTAASGRTGKEGSELRTGDLSFAESEEIQGLREESERFDQVRLFVTERKAYTELFALVSELCQAVPGYSQYIQEKQDEGYVLDRPVTDDEIVQGYHFNSNYI